MNVSRETMIDWGVPIAATVLFILAVGIVGALFGTNGLSSTGGLAMIVVIVAFVLGMALVGLTMGGGEE